MSRVKNHKKIKKPKKSYKSQNSLSENKSYPSSDRKQDGTPSDVLLSGSFTLEATVCLPVFATFLVVAMFFLRLLMVEQNLTESMELSARKLSTAAFAENIGVSEGLLDVSSLPAAIALVNKDYSKKSEGEGYRYMLLGKAALNLTGSDVTGDYVDLNAAYVTQLPVNLLGKRSLLMKRKVKARKWNGYELDGGQGEEEDDIWVYVTPHGTVYHMDCDCHYLNLSVRSVSKNSVSSLRNKDGSSYAPCAVCGKKASASGLVYVTDYGGSYHTNINCSGLKRGIDMIKKKEAEAKGYGACSKCGH